MIEIDFVRSRFIKHFDGKTGNVYASPGRINLIGEHTDYNGGFVFPGAVDKGIMAEIRANGTEDTVMAYAIDLKDRVDFHLNDPKGPKASWSRYIYAGTDVNYDTLVSTYESNVEAARKSLQEYIDLVNSTENKA